jgi:hypothetical protein
MLHEARNQRRDDHHGLSRQEDGFAAVYIRTSPSYKDEAALGVQERRSVVGQHQLAIHGP